MILRACHGCRRHVRVDEDDCPFCRAPLERVLIRRAGPLPRVTRAALVTVGAVALAACGSEIVLHDDPGAEPGAGGATNSGTTSASSASVSSGAGGMGGMGGEMGLGGIGPLYGAPGVGGALTPTGAGGAGGQPVNDGGGQGTLYGSPPEPGEDPDR